MAYDRGELRYKTDNTGGVCAAWTVMWVNNLLTNPISLYWTKATLPATFSRNVATDRQGIYENMLSISSEYAEDTMVKSINAKLKLRKTKADGALHLEIDPAEDLRLELFERFDVFAESMGGLTGPIYASLLVSMTDRNAAHALGFYLHPISRSFYVFDPNKGLVRYDGIEGFRNDFIALFTEGGMYHEYLNGFMTLRRVALI